MDGGRALGGCHLSGHCGALGGCHLSGHFFTCLDITLRAWAGCAESMVQRELDVFYLQLVGRPAGWVAPFDHQRANNSGRNRLKVVDTFRRSGRAGWVAPVGTSRLRRHVCGQACQSGDRLTYSPAATRLVGGTLQSPRSNLLGGCHLAIGGATGLVGVTFRSPFDHPWWVAPFDRGWHLSITTFRSPMVGRRGA